MQYITIGSLCAPLGKGLAQRELECLLSVAGGQTDKQIAQRDGLSPRSVKGRIESVMNKLGVYKRAALVAEAFRLGLILPCSASTPNPEHPRPGRNSCDGVFVA